MHSLKIQYLKILRLKQHRIVFPTQKKLKAALTCLRHINFQVKAYLKWIVHWLTQDADKKQLPEIYIYILMDRSVM
jgi:hypothetical protein